MIDESYLFFSFIFNNFTRKVTSNIRQIAYGIKKKRNLNLVSGPSAKNIGYIKVKYTRNFKRLPNKKI